MPTFAELRDYLNPYFDNYIVPYGIRVVTAVLVFLVGLLVARIARRVLTRVLQRGKADPTLVSFVGSVSYVSIICFAIIAALGRLGVQTASLVAILGAAGLAIGLALQGSLSNFAAGVLMIVFKPFKVGDFVEGAGTAGTVVEIGIFTTELKTPDNRKVIVPNSKISSDNIVNYTTHATRRLDVPVSVSYASDLARVRDVLNGVIAADPRVLADPAPAVLVAKLAESGIDITVRVWVDRADYWPTLFSMQEKIKTTFDREGIEIPFPQRDIHIRSDFRAKP